MSTITTFSPRGTTPARAAASCKFSNAQEWHSALGEVPLRRILCTPWPGQATEQDQITLVERDKRLVELMYRTLVEKPVGTYESLIAGIIMKALLDFVAPRK